MAYIICPDCGTQVEMLFDICPTCHHEWTTAEIRDLATMVPLKQYETEITRFESRQLREAIQHARQGGIALHVHAITLGHPLFSRYPFIAHLFDQDKERLMNTAYRLGVKVIKVEREGQDSQHIDLCGRPFERACREAQLAQLKLSTLRVEKK